MYGYMNVVVSNELDRSLPQPFRNMVHTELDGLPKLLTAKSQNMLIASSRTEKVKIEQQSATQEKTKRTFEYFLKHAP